MAEHWFCKPVVVGSTPTASFPATGPAASRGATAGRWPSGQWHQTVNLADCVLRGFESLPAHSRKDDGRRMNRREGGRRGRRGKAKPIRCGPFGTPPSSFLLHPLRGCGCSSMVEHLPSKQVVGSSILLTRSGRPRTTGGGRRRGGSGAVALLSSGGPADGGAAVAQW